MQLPDSIQQLEQNQGFVRGLARTLLADESLVDEVVQRAYLAALRSPPDQAGRFRGWVSVVVRNTARTVLRDEGRRAARERGAARPEEAPAPADPIEVAELRAFLAEGVLSLREPYRTTVILYYYQELDSVEIGALQGVPSNTVRVRLARALEMLRERLQSVDDDRRKVGACLLALSGVSTAGISTATTATTGVSTTGTATTPTPVSSSGAATTLTQGRWGAGAVLVGIALLVCVPLLVFPWISDARRNTQQADNRANQGAPTVATSDRAVGSVLPVPAAGTQTGTLSESGGLEAGAPVPASFHEDGAAAASTWTYAKVVVVDANTGAPVRGAKVWSNPPDLSSRRLSQGRRAADLLLQPYCEGTPLLTGASGSVALPLEALQRHRLLVQAPGYRPHRERAQHRRVEPTNVGEASRVLTYQVRLAPAPAAEVVLEAANSLLEAGETQVTRYEPHGATQRLVCAADGSYPFLWDASDFLIHVRRAGCAEIRVLATAPVTRVSLEPGIRGAGQVVDTDGVPLPEARIELSWSGWQGTPWAVEVDASGSFETPALPREGVATLRIIHPEHVALKQEVELPWGGAGEVVPRRFTLTRGARITGRIVGPRGAAVSDVVVRLLPEGRFRARNVNEATSDATGHFHLVGVVPGEYALAVSHDTYWLAERTVSLAAGDAPHLSLQMRFGHPVSGRATTPTGDAASGVHLQLGRICGDELWGPSVITDADGRFTFESAPAAAYPTRPALRDIAWSALYGDGGDVPERGLVLRVHHPDRLLFTNGVEVPSQPLIGSRNTCGVAPGAANLDLVVALAQPENELSVELLDPNGLSVRTVTNLFLFPSNDPLNGRIGIFCGTDGIPRNLHDPAVLRDSLAMFVTRTHAVAFADLSAPGAAHSVVLEPRVPRLLRLRYSDDQVGADMPLFVAPIVDGTVAGCALFIGVSDGSGRLTVDFLPGGEYSLFTHQGSVSELTTARTCMARVALQPVVATLRVDSADTHLDVRLRRD